MGVRPSIGASVGSVREAVFVQLGLRRCKTRRATGRCARLWVRQETCHREFYICHSASLGNKTPGGGGRYGGWVRRGYCPVRAAYQGALFVVIVIAADQIIALKRLLVIWWQSYVTGYPVEEILRQQDASSGMWAFGELLETIFLVVLSTYSGRYVLMPPPGYASCGPGAEPKAPEERPKS
jgi:hypothetical protein